MAHLHARRRQDGGVRRCAPAGAEQATLRVPAAAYAFHPPTGTPTTTRLYTVLGLSDHTRKVTSPAARAIDRCLAGWSGALGLAQAMA